MTTPGAQLTARVSTDGMFYTVQGEGPLTGVPSVFVRLDTCNLKCRWGDTLCDAAYTSWTPSGQRVPLARLVRDVGAMLLEHNCRYLVITGGEPALQPDVVRALTYAARLGQWGDIRLGVVHTTLETNGTLYIKESGLDLVCLSPKLRSSTPVGSQFEKVHERNRHNPDALRAWMQYGAYYFKFVVDKESDIEDAWRLLEEVNLQPDPLHVLLMPQGIDSERLWAKGRWLAERCKQLGVRFTPRIQVDLWGNTPGT